MIEKKTFQHSFVAGHLETFIPVKSLQGEFTLTKKKQDKSTGMTTHHKPKQKIQHNDQMKT